MGAYELAMPSGEGHRRTPLSSPAKLPTAVAPTKASHLRPLDNKIETPEMNATSARRIHRGKSRLGTIIAGHQQTADPTKARRSKILFRVIASSPSHAKDGHN
jgi:hypothetical protein